MSEFYTRCQLLSALAVCRGVGHQLGARRVATDPASVANVTLGVSPDASTVWVGVGGSLCSHKHKSMPKISENINIL